MLCHGCGVHLHPVQSVQHQHADALHSPAEAAIPVSIHDGEPEPLGLTSAAVLSILHKPGSTQTHVHKNGPAQCVCLARRMAAT